MTRPILTAAAMRHAEQTAIDTGTSVEVLMERAGSALGEAVFQHCGMRPVLMLCGPGNNGGDGHVAARVLRAKGVAVRIATITGGKGYERLEEAAGAPVLVDCLFGTGLKRKLDADVAARLAALAEQASIAVACDLPSGISSDCGAILSPVPRYDLTVAMGALKPAHRLMPAMAKMGRVVVADIGVAAISDWHEIASPRLPGVAIDAHKYSRGMVHCLAGSMPGAIALSALAAARSGAGYVRISTSQPISGLPHAIVQAGDAPLNDPRIGCLVVGPGMGDIPAVLTLALTSRAPKLIDADALRHVGDPERLHGQDAVLTPHEGEFAALFPEMQGSKAERVLEAARLSQSVVVLKGPDTLVASPDGRLGFAPPAPAWLASAGSGDVLSGMIAAYRARGMAAFEAACAGVWVQGQAAKIAGPSMIADDLITAISAIEA